MAARGVSKRRVLFGVLIAVILTMIWVLHRARSMSLFGPSSGSGGDAASLAALLSSHAGLRPRNGRSTGSWNAAVRPFHKLRSEGADGQAGDPHDEAAVAGALAVVKKNAALNKLVKRLPGEEIAATDEQQVTENAPNAHNGAEEAETKALKWRTPLAVQPLLPQSVMDLLNREDSMVDLEDDATNKACVPPIDEKESSTNTAFLKEFTRIFKYNFSNLPWMLDEGGLIGSSRVGSMANADDDFDFLALLPNQHAPCSPDSLTCTPEQFNDFIHDFLMVFWNAGMCINKFHPNRAKFVSRMRLMYSFQLGRRADVPPEQCFIQGKPFAHMHLGIFNDKGLFQTNIWAKGTTHPMDELDLSLLLPVRRCRSGMFDAPCPNNITGFLTVRNRGEYRKKSSDGSCLLVRAKWGIARKKMAVEKVRRLQQCGYNSIVDLADDFERSGYKSC